jgi:RHS repeat-associated protein
MLINVRATSVRRWLGLGIVGAVLALPTSAQAVEKASERVSPFYGSFSYSIPIEVPPFHGISPGLTLGYTSEGRNGIVGVGWALSGFSTIERVNGNLGTPAFDTNDKYTLDGQELVACLMGSVSPSCTTGGSHSTKDESYLKIKFTSATNTWSVWGKDGTRTDYSPTLNVTSGTLRWGQTSITDTKSNQMSFTWTCVDGDCYPSTIAYNGYSITLYREARNDKQSFAAHNAVNEQRYRIRSIVVRGAGSANIRGYQLSYIYSPLTGRSLLTSVQQFGKDLVVDGAGAITGGTSLPPVTFSYQDDTIGRSFPSTAANPPTPPGTVEPVTWTNLVNTTPTGSGNSLYKGNTTWAWNAGATSVRAITSGDGYVEFTAVSGGPTQMAGLSNGNTDTNYTDIDFALYQNGLSLYASENGTLYGPWSVGVGDVLRVEVTSGVVKYKKNGTVLRTSTRTPTYPLLVDAAIDSPGTTIRNAMLSGTLQDVSFWCNGTLYTGDFNGDGRTDQLCQNGQGLRVSLATATGFAAPTTWSTGSLYQPAFGDFNNDGKTDIMTQSSGSDKAVMLSTGTAFTAASVWGTASGIAQDGHAYGCGNTDPLVHITGDFNGDGITDVACKVTGSGPVFVGISNGSSFSFSSWGLWGCGTTETFGALDFNGDGRDDWYCIGLQYNNMNVYQNTGGAFIYPYNPVPPSFCGGQYVLGDFNGDGRTDITCPSNGAVALSSGGTGGFQTWANQGAWCSGADQIFAADVDGDGNSEVVCKVTSNIVVRKWQNNAFAAAQTWKAGWCSANVIPGEYNGDGKTDLLCPSLANPIALAGTGGFQSDLLSSIGNGLGGTIQATYTSSVNFTSLNSPPPKWAISTVSRNDGRGGVATTQYSYWDAFMNRQERRFLGFGHVRETKPCITGESACRYVDTWLTQTIASAGKPYKIETRDGAGKILQTALFNYTETTSPLPRTSLLTSEWTHIYDGNSSATCSTWPCGIGKRVYTTHQYDAYGNATQTSHYGDYDSANDDTTTATSFTPNTTAYIVGKVGRVQQFAGIGTGGQKLTEIQLQYDGATSWTTPPTQGYATKVLNWLDVGNRYLAKTIAYDSYGNQTSVADETNRAVTSTYDGTYHQYLASTSNAAAETESLVWDPICSTPSQRTDVRGQLTTYQADALCRPTRTDLPLGGFEIRSYLNVGNPTTQNVRTETPSPSPEDGTGNRWTAAYFDGLGRTYRQSAKGPAAQSIESQVTYNARGGRATATAPYYSGDAMQTTTYSYDGFDRPIAVTHPDGNDISKTYGLLSEITTDENGHDSKVQADAYGRKTMTEQYHSGQPVDTFYTYDLLGRLTGMTDVVGSAWSWSFDSLGRNTQKMDPDAGTWTYAYDDAGRVTSQTDAKSQQTTLTYDSVGRPSTKTNSAGTVTFTYSEPRTGFYNTGQLTTITSPGTTLKSDYDAAGRMIKQTRTFAVFPGQEYVRQQRYDSGGYLRGITYPDNDAVGTPADPLLYDGAGELKSIPGVITNVTYDAAGRPLQQTNANGTVTTRTYAPQRGFLTGIGTTAGASTIQNLTYGIDPAGLATGVTSPFTNESWTYTYDDLRRLTSAVNASTPAESQTFQYDLAGRMTYNSKLGYYTYPAAGSPRPHAPTDVGGSAMAYDLNGNLTSGSGRTITWNADNLPTQINTGQYTYDGLGTRITRVYGSNVVYYPFGDDVAFSTTTMSKYISVPGLGVVAKRAGSPPSVTRYWMHTDRLGSIQAITDSSGQLVQRRTYRPYGEKIADSTSLSEPMGYIGERLDSDTGLTYLHARYYDAAAGLFVSPDPAHPSDPAVGLNRYAYAADDPVNSSDRSGLSKEVCCIRPINPS